MPNPIFLRSGFSSEQVGLLRSQSSWIRSLNLCVGSSPSASEMIVSSTALIPILTIVNLEEAILILFKILFH